ncbi:MAG: LptF/LptG family permease [Bacteroidota bacterium]
MKKLHIFIIKSYLGPFVLTFFIALFVLLLQFIWKYIDDLVGKGLEWYLITELLLYTSVSLVPMALPLAILISSIMTFGNLGEHYELAALKSAGLSLQRIMFPLIITSICICIAAFYFSNYILPIANLKMGALLWDIRQQRPALNIKENVFYNGIDGYSIKVGKKNKDNRKIEDIIIYDHTSKMGNNKVVIAKSGSMEMSGDERYLIITLHDGYSYDEMDAYKRKDKNTRQLKRMKFIEQSIRFDLSIFKLVRTSEDLFRDHYQMLNMRQLQSAVDSMFLQIEGKRHNYVDRLSNNYFFGKHKLQNLNQHITPKLEKFERKERIKIIETAINQARSAKIQAFSIKNDLKCRKTSIIKHQVEWHRKLTLSFACLLLFFIGAPLGAIIRKGGLGMPIVVSVIFFILFHVLSIMGEKFVKETILLPYQGMWLASIVCIPIGIFLTYKATTDSVIFNMEFYKFPFLLRFFRRLQKLSSRIGILMFSHSR